MSNKTYENYNIIPNAIRDFDKETILSIYKDVYRLRKFEELLIESISKNGKKNIRRIHLSTGQECAEIALAHIFPKANYFITHRCVELFIALGTKLEPIRDEIFCLDTGCAKGKAGSLFSCITNDTKIYSHTGFIGEQIPIAVGYALASGEQTICITGDGGAEEDYALQAYGFASTHKLPILFVCIDNDLSVLSKTKERRSWKLTELAKAMGMNILDVTDDPFTLMKVFNRFKNKMPAFINIRVNRGYCHSGIEKSKKISWDRFTIIKQQIIKLGYSKEILKIEEEANREMHQLWRNYL